MRTIRKGDYVLILAPDDDPTAKEITKYNGLAREVKEIVRVKRKSSVFRYYILDGCESEKGRPYGFAPEWVSLIPYGIEKLLIENKEEDEWIGTETLRSTTVYTEMQRSRKEK